MRHTEVYCDRKLEIEQALLEMLKDQPLSDIRIKDLAAKLKLVRKTFYHYYPNKMVCMESLTDRILYECSLYQMQTVPEGAGLYEQYTAEFQFWLAHKDFLDAIIRNNMSAFFAGRVLEYLKREFPDLLAQMHTANVACDEDVLFFYISGEVSLLLKWCAEGFRLSAEEMAEKTIRLTYEPLIAQQESE